MQLGAEIFGCGGIEADIEVVDLLLSLVERSGLSDITFDIGHVAFCELVMCHVGLSSEQQNTVLELLARKANSDLDRLLTTLSREQAEKISVLATMHGGIEVLERARAAFVDIEGLEKVIGEVEAVLACCQRLQGRGECLCRYDRGTRVPLSLGVVFACTQRNSVRRWLKAAIRWRR